MTQFTKGYNCQLYITISKNARFKPRIVTWKFYKLKIIHDHYTIPPLTSLVYYLNNCCDNIAS